MCFMQLLYITYMCTYIMYVIKPMKEILYTVETYVVSFPHTQNIHGGKCEYQCWIMTRRCMLLFG